MEARKRVHQAIDTVLNADPDARLASWATLFAFLGYSVQGCSSVSYLFYLMSAGTFGVLSDRKYQWSQTLFGNPATPKQKIVIAERESTPSPKRQ